MDKENPVALPHARPALQAPRFEETALSSGPVKASVSPSTHSTGPALVAGQIHQYLATQTSSTDALPSSVQKRGCVQGLERAEQ